MTNKKNFRKILNGVGSAALFVGLSLSPVGLNAAFANSPGEHGGTPPAMAQNAGMGQNANMQQGNTPQGNMQQGNTPQGNMQQGNMPSNMNPGQGPNHTDEAREHANEAANSRPMILRDFMESLRNGTTIADAQRSDHQIIIVYSDGWQEELANNRYELTDPNGNVIISRPAVQRDFDRLNSAF